MKKLLFLPLLAALLLAACDDSNVDEGQENGERVGHNSFLCEGSPIYMYFEPDTVLVHFFSSLDGANSLGFFVRTCNYSNFEYCTESHWFRESGKFNNYAAYYGDTTYSAIHSMSAPGYDVSAMPLKSISITADRDFDAEHPAGSRLNDLFVLAYSSAYDLIISGYDRDLNIAIKSNPFDAYQQIPLSEFEPKNLLHSWMDLYFTKLPDTLGEYTFTITFEYGTDPVSGKEAKKVAPAVVKAVFTEADYVNVPVHEPLNKGE